MGHSKAYAAEFRPLSIKELCIDCDISQGDLAKGIQVSRALVNVAINKGYLPPSLPDFKGRVESYLSGSDRAMAVKSWLAEHGLTLVDIWRPLGKDMRNATTSDHGIRCHVRRGNATIPGDPCEIISNVEVEMITQEARKHFKLFRDPFPANGGVEKDSDIFLSDDHRFIEAAMLDAAKHSGLIAVIGQVGSGKSTIRKRVFEQLRKDGGILTVFPQILDKDRINSSSLCDAIVLDVSDQKPRVKHEAKARQVRELLLARSRNGDRCCLVIEEAHKLTVNAFITLKQLWELEDGYNKLLSIIIIGQTELANRLDERHHPEMREFIRRCQIARINGLNGDTRNYLEHKFKRVGASMDAVFAPDAIDVLSKRLTSIDERGKPVSHAYPLTVNLYAVRAINMAAEIGEAKVTAEIVEAI